MSRATDVLAGLPEVRVWQEDLYRDLHEHLDALKEMGLLVTVDRQIDRFTQTRILQHFATRAGVDVELDVAEPEIGSDGQFEPTVLLDRLKIGR